VLRVESFQSEIGIRHSWFPEKSSPAQTSTKRHGSLLSLQPALSSYPLWESRSASNCRRQRTVPLSLSSEQQQPSLSSVLLEGIGYKTAVRKPLGVIFSENSAPFFGLVVVDVEIGLNGGKAGLRVGDQLVAVNGEPCLQQDFDTCMAKLINADTRSPLELQMFRGSPRDMYTILENKQENAISIIMDDAGDEEAVEVVMDESYESPVVVPVDESDIDGVDDIQLTPQDISKVFSNVASSFFGNLGKENVKRDPAGDGKSFLASMFQQETIQLDGDDATTLK
jgi:PDZ domain